VAYYNIPSLSLLQFPHNDANNIERCRLYIAYIHKNNNARLYSYNEKATKKNRSKFRYHTAVLYYLILFTLLLFFLPYVFGQLFPVIYPVVL